MSRKTALTYQDRQRLEFLTSHLRSSARPSVKARYENEIAQLLEGKELSRGDIALASYYLSNSGNSPEDANTAREFAAAYRATPAE
ncbi:hypothetical protein BOO88_08580 [Stutzerimonas stutzeri]|nr:hypothetical protein BOO89_10300 [Stutzerimonas stutzeri]AZO88980.1 hypothetical protein BOO88_08580 [Stutzerimonas stutzeri]